MRSINIFFYKMTQNILYFNNFYLEILNNLTLKVDYIIKFSITSLILLIFLSICLILAGLIIILITHLASRGPKILDTGSKVVTIATGSTVLYNNWIKDESSGSGSGNDDNKKDENKKDDNEKDKNKKDESKNEENKEDKSVDKGKNNEK